MRKTKGEALSDRDGGDKRNPLFFYSLNIAKKRPIWTIKLCLTEALLTGVANKKPFTATRSYWRQSVEEGTRRGRGIEGVKYSARGNISRAGRLPSSRSAFTIVSFRYRYQQMSDLSSTLVFWFFSSQIFSCFSINFFAFVFDRNRYTVRYIFFAPRWVIL